jgi:hypothetical protein
LGKFPYETDAEARQQNADALALTLQLSIDVQPPDTQMALAGAQIKIQPWISYKDSFAAVITI